MNTITKEWLDAPWSERVGFVIEAAAYLGSMALIGFYIFMIVWTVARVL